MTLTATLWVTWSYISSGFLLKTNFRKGTVVARFGGEEFAVILPNAVLHTAHLTLDNTRKLVESSIATEDGKPITISVGVCEAKLNDPAGLNWTQQALIQRSDESLYRAKRSGRNRVCSLEDVNAEGTQS